jgi:hypothetical protein
MENLKKSIKPSGALSTSPARSAATGTLRGILPQFTSYTQSRIYDYILILYWPPFDAERHVIEKDNLLAEALK